MDYMVMVMGCVDNIDDDYNNDNHEYHGPAIMNDM